MTTFRGLLAGNAVVEIKTPPREAAYAVVAETLCRFGYARLGNADQGLRRR